MYKCHPRPLFTVMSDMTNEQKQSMEDAVKAFMDKATLKYVAGQKEHGGVTYRPLSVLNFAFNRSTLNHAFEYALTTVCADRQV